MRIPSARRLLVATYWLGVALVACADTATPWGDLALPLDGGAAVLVVHDADCDSNLGSMGVFLREDVRRGLPLVAVVALDSAADTALIRRSLGAFDVPARLVPVSRMTLDSLRSLTHGDGMTLVVFEAARPVGVIPPPRSLDEAVGYMRRIRAIAARLHRR